MPGRLRVKVNHNKILVRPLWSFISESWFGSCGQERVKGNIQCLHLEV